LIFKLQRFAYLSSYIEGGSFSEWSSLARVAVKMELSPLSPIVQIGEKSEHVFLVDAGEVAILRCREVTYTREHIAESLAGTVTTGNSFGENEVLRDIRM